MCLHAQTLATVQAQWSASIWTVPPCLPSPLFVFPKLFWIGQNQKLPKFNCTIRWLAEWLREHHWPALPPAALDSKQLWRVSSKADPLVEWEHGHTITLSHSFLLFLPFSLPFPPSPTVKKKKSIILGIKLSLVIGKLMLVSLNKGCAKQKSFPWGKDLQVMPILHCLFLFQAAEVFGTMRPWSLTGVSWHYHSLNNIIIQ